MRTASRPLSSVFACTALALAFAASPAHAQAVQGMQARDQRMTLPRDRLIGTGAEQVRSKQPQSSQQPNLLEQLEKERRPKPADDGRDKSTGPDVIPIGGDNINQIELARKEAARRKAECLRKAQTPAEAAACEVIRAASRPAFQAVDVRRDKP